MDEQMPMGLVPDQLLDDKVEFPASIDAPIGVKPAVGSNSGMMSSQDPIEQLTDTIGSLGISATADKDNNAGKLFVGGLSWETSKDGLAQYFSKFGEVSECVIITDPHTGRSRGFGFVSFTDPSVAADVINRGPHNLDNRKIDPKPAVPRGTASKSSLNAPHHVVKTHGQKTRKIFVGGLNPETTQEGLTSFFSDFGAVENVVLMYDRETKRPRGFGFVTFASEEPVIKLCQMHFIELNGKMVEIKMAQPKSNGDGRRGRPFNHNRNFPFTGYQGQPGYANGGYHPAYANQGFHVGYNGQMYRNYDMQNFAQQGQQGRFMPMFYAQNQQFAPENQQQQLDFNRNKQMTNSFNFGSSGQNSLLPAQPQTYMRGFDEVQFAGAQQGSSNSNNNDGGVPLTNLGFLQQDEALPNSNAMHRNR